MASKVIFTVEQVDRSRETTDGINVSGHFSPVSPWPDIHLFTFKARVFGLRKSRFVVVQSQSDGRFDAIDKATFDRRFRYDEVSDREDRFDLGQHLIDRHGVDAAQPGGWSDEKRKAEHDAMHAIGGWDHSREG